MLEELNQVNLQNHADQGLNSSHDETVRIEAQHEKAVAIAIKLIAKGIPIEETAELTDLPKEEIERLQKKHQ